ncbi:aspartate carbamoyltransferase regulatory subunit [Fervidicoccus fontis]|uniref:Aspartate carbamoyltransferase regulatory chain n=1 Tax=Fervidicoccus fontis (strain DSM 19380 / JCM 18336 / VKM B-2539 / Kam940) TaxID=1163730 RepID=H9ZZW5_FERFK|nr:aspartate carbamoyltransferase regulatory subunit [Fervidicoccus fontis]AFH42272.1 aspartate carbamoyltransferase regulatory subunit [Fervidicoccus fontis Kam940]
MSEKSTLVVSKIKHGTVIDHIPAGKAMNILSVLGIRGEKGDRIAIIMNVESEKLGKKDIIKIEGKWLEPRDFDVISLIAPSATVNIVENFEVVKKYKVSLPDRVEGLLKCPNMTCITNERNESIKTKFKVLSRDPLKLQCEYCGTIIYKDDIVKLTNYLKK